GDDLDVFFHLQDGPQALAEERVIVHDDDAVLGTGKAHAYILRSMFCCVPRVRVGTVTATSAPCPGCVQMLSEPPMAAVRSRMDHGAAVATRKPSASTLPLPLRK